LKGPIALGKNQTAETVKKHSILQTTGELFAPVKSQPRDLQTRQHNGKSNRGNDPWMLTLGFPYCEPKTIGVFFLPFPCGPAFIDEKTSKNDGDLKKSHRCIVWMIGKLFGQHGI